MQLKTANDLDHSRSFLRMRYDLSAGVFIFLRSNQTINQMIKMGGAKIGTTTMKIQIRKSMIPR